MCVSVVHISGGDKSVIAVGGKKGISAAGGNRSIIITRGHYSRETVHHHHYGPASDQLTGEPVL